MRSFESMKEWLIKKSAETSGREVARLTGVHHSNISKICNGRVNSPMLDTMMKIDRAMSAYPLQGENMDTRSFVLIAYDGERLSMKTDMESPEKCIGIISNALCGLVHDNGYLPELLINHIEKVFASLKEKEASCQ